MGQHIRSEEGPDGQKRIVVDGQEGIDELAELTEGLDRPKVGSAPEGFKISADVERVASHVIERFPNRFGDLVNHRIVYLLDEGKIPTGGEIDTIAKAQLAPKLWAAIADVEGAIWVNGIWWKTGDDVKREAVVFHELCHFIENEKGALAVVAHDIEAFIGEARFYGSWRPEFGMIAEQLRLFDRDGQAATG